ncbi:diaminopropionate ammonia-lyase [Burkholderia cenocepacia]|uniref:diaminopropionate ammonia-lyase n=1 Tax=Burkholderia cenocepacia TaxID=95486 RepID=UPI002AB62C0B|nr:diaminopropionate ammonia-lyase [Burkholderia cenocepacia]
MLIANRQASHTDYPHELKTILSVESAEQSRAWLKDWKLLNARATPLWELPDAAARLGVARLSIKDESVRSPLGSFKALGAPIALVRLILRLWPDHDLDPEGLIQGRYKDMLANLVVITATDGNHGKALAAAAQTLGCNCVIVLHANVSAEREQAIAAYGAQIIRIEGNYDESVEHAAHLAKKNGWHVVSDTSYDGYETIPRDVMQGYGAIAAEIIEQSGGHAEECAFTHIFLQGGVGGLAAGVASYLWETYGRKRPRFVVVEPQQADCLYQSAREGRPAKATGSVDSVMAGLACGETSPLAWKILAPCMDHFMTISDEDAIAAMSKLAAGTHADIPLVVGESGAAGYAGVDVLMNDSQLARTIGLNSESRVLVISTEGATAPSVYRECVGETADSVLARQVQWREAAVR